MTRPSLALGLLLMAFLGVISGLFILFWNGSLNEALHGPSALVDSVRVKTVFWSGARKYVSLKLLESDPEMHKYSVFIDGVECLSAHYGNQTIVCNPKRRIPNNEYVNVKLMKKLEDGHFKLVHEEAIKAPPEPSSKIACTVPEGKTSCAPHFIMVGAFKCATTSVFKYLSMHPNIAIPVERNRLPPHRMGGPPDLLGMDGDMRMRGDRMHGERMRGDMRMPPGRDFNRMAQDTIDENQDYSVTKTDDKEENELDLLEKEIGIHFGMISRHNHSESNALKDSEHQGVSRLSRELLTIHQGRPISDLDFNDEEVRRRRNLKNKQPSNPNQMVTVRQKELHFFDHFVNARQLPADLLDKYMNLFPDIHPGDDLMTGEATPNYIYVPKVPEMISKYLPHVKIIIMVREPFSRAYSQYCHKSSLALARFHIRAKRDNNFIDQSKKSNAFELKLEEQDKFVKRFLDYIKAEKQVIQDCMKKHTNWTDLHPCLISTKPYNKTRHPPNLVDRTYLSHSWYAPQLAHWYRFFPKESILVIRTEDIYTRANEVMDEITRFLGLPPIMWSEMTKTKYNVGVLSSGRNPGVPVQELGLIPGDDDIHLKCPKLPKDVIQEFKKFFIPMNEELEKMVGRKLWTYKQQI